MEFDMTDTNAQRANTTDTRNGTVTDHRTFWEAGFRVVGMRDATPDGHCTCRNPACPAVRKHPRFSNWQHTPHWSDKQLERLEAMGHFNTGYGIVCHIDDEFDLLVVDVDARNDGLEAYDRLLKRVPEVAGAGLIVKTGSGGGSRHIYFKVRKKAALATKHPDYNGIDFKSGAGFVVGPGSLHASGNYYEVVSGSPEDIKEAPEELVRLLQKPERHRADLGNRSGDVSNADLAEMVRYITGFDDYEVWVRVGMALHHSSDGTAFEVWDQWSSRSVKYRPEEMKRKWRSFGNSATPVTMGTLIHLAKQGGWQRPETFLSPLEFEVLEFGKDNGAAQEEPQPLVREIKAGEPYPVDALGPLKGDVEYVQGRTLAPMAIPAQSALAVASLAVMGFANVETLGGTSPTGLYFLSIANSGERKSSCDNYFMKEVRTFEREAARQHAKETEQWMDESAIWKAKHDDLIKKAKGGDELAKQDLKDLGSAPVPPRSGDLVVTEPTYEGLTRAFKEGRPALGIFADEGGQFLGGNAMNSDNRLKTLAALNDLWGGNPIKRTRQGEGSYTLVGRRLSMHLMIQPLVAKAFMADPQTVDTGFLPRFLITQPASTIGTRLQAEVREKSFLGMGGFGYKLADILDTKLPMDERTGELQPRLLTLSGEARQLLSAYSDEVELKQAPNQPYRNITGFASKSAEQAARIAGVLTLWQDLQAQEVTAETMENAITLARYYLAEANRLISGAMVDAEIDRAEKLRVWLMETWKEPEITSRDVVQSGPNSVRDTKTAKKALQMLAEHGWLVALPPGTVIRGSARSQSWRVVR
jgi:hypothetical protein